MIRGVGSAQSRIFFLPQPFFSFAATLPGRINAHNESTIRFYHDGTMPQKISL